MVAIVHRPSPAFKENLLSFQAKIVDPRNALILTLKSERSEVLKGSQTRTGFLFCGVFLVGSVFLTSVMDKLERESHLAYTQLYCLCGTSSKQALCW